MAWPLLTPERCVSCLKDAKGVALIQNEVGSEGAILFHWLEIASLLLVKLESEERYLQMVLSQWRGYLDRLRLLWQLVAGAAGCELHHDCCFLE